MTRKVGHFGRALWQYLNQSLFDSESEFVWKPSRFWFYYKIRLLEKCWKKEIDSKSHHH